jgi:hypothetical protein
VPELISVWWYLICVFLPPSLSGRVYERRKIYRWPLKKNLSCRLHYTTLSLTFVVFYLVFLCLSLILFCFALFVFDVVITDPSLSFLCCRCNMCGPEVDYRLAPQHGIVSHVSIPWIFMHGECTILDQWSIDLRFLFWLKQKQHACSWKWRGSLVQYFAITRHTPLKRIRTGSGRGPHFFADRRCGRGKSRMALQ